MDLIPRSRRVAGVLLILVLLPACLEDCIDPGTPDSGEPLVPSADSGVGDGAAARGNDAEALADCLVDDDCRGEAPLTQPAGCAEPTCVAGSCVFRPLDFDRDGYRDALCQSLGSVAIEAGTDCDDRNSAIKPGAVEQCDDLDNDCDGAVDDDIPSDPNQPCTVGAGVCRNSGSRTCVHGQWSGCDAQPLPPQGADAPRCDGNDYDCNGMAREGCACLAGETSVCRQPCQTLTLSCQGGVMPSCDANGGAQPQRYCRDGDGDQHASACADYCEPPPAGVSPGRVEVRPSGYVRSEMPLDDCNDSDPNGYPNRSCGPTCSAVSCTACAACPPGFYEWNGICRADGSGESYFGFGDSLRGLYGNYSLPAFGGAAMGHFAVNLWTLDVNPGGCCGTGSGDVAILRCYDAGQNLIIERAFYEYDFARGGWGHSGGNDIVIDHPGLLGGRCEYELRDNRRTCCCGCWRRFTDTVMYATANRCSP